MNKHELALHHAMKALILIEDELISRTSGESEGVSNEDRFTVMVIALHNIAVEHEYLKQVSYSKQLIHWIMPLVFIIAYSLQKSKRFCCISAK